MNKVFLLIIGESGVGKTTIANTLEETDGLKQIPSYTNRPMRTKNECRHIFLTDQNIERIKKKYPDRIAETVFDGHFYFSTNDQVDEYDTYVISPDAVAMFKQNYHGNKTVKVIYVKTPEFLRRIRMNDRGDTALAVEARIKHDKLAFTGAEEMADLIVRNFVLSESIEEIRKQIKVWGSEGECNAKKNKDRC